MQITRREMMKTAAVVAATGPVSWAGDKAAASVAPPPEQWTISLYRGDNTPRGPFQQHEFVLRPPKVLRTDIPPSYPAGAPPEGALIWCEGVESIDCVEVEAPGRVGKHGHRAVAGITKHLASLSREPRPEVEFGMFTWVRGDHVYKASIADFHLDVYGQRWAAFPDGESVWAAFAFPFLSGKVERYALCTDEFGDLAGDPETRIGYRLETRADLRRMFCEDMGLPDERIQV